MESGIVSSKHPLECPWYRDWHHCNCGLFEVLLYSEPGKNEEVITHRVTVEDAIDKQILYAKSMGHFYTNQKDALDDFISLHFAIYEKI